MNKCKFSKYIENACAVIEQELCPEDFLDCDTIDDLQESIEDYFNENIDTGDFMIYESDYDCSIPEEFIKEWKKLKGYE